MPSKSLTTALIIIALAAFAALGIYFAQLPGGRSLDFIFTVGGLVSTLDMWAEADKAYHVWGTRVLDSLLPTAYTAAALVAFARYYTGRKYWVYSALVIAAMTFDFWENSMNLDLLAGGRLMAVPHVLATWGKFLCLIPVLPGLWLWVQDLSGQRS